VSETPENAALAELLGAISDRRIRRKVQKLLQLGEEAVRSLGELDSALYLREDGEAQLQIVADAVLSHFRRLLEFLGMVAASVEGSGEAVPREVDVEFSAGDSLEGHVASSRRAEGAPGPREALDILADRQRPDDDKWHALAAGMDTLQYGLGSELREFDRRFSDALKHDRKEQAVRDLNDATTSLMDGVFAVMTTVYECFLGYAEPERMIPGHRDTLGKALAVRRAVAELRREVRELNRSIQDPDGSPLVIETSYKLVVQALVRFIDDDVFFYVRSDDRKEFEHFRDLLTQGDPERSRQECEGLDKYLDSLAFVSQRGVLIKHDADLRAKIAVEVERALAFAEIFPEAVCEAIHEAFVRGDRLFGLDDRLDTLVHRWFSLSEDKRNDPQQAVAMARLLRELVEPAR
jgi:hypothetical protein